MRQHYGGSGMGNIGAVEAVPSPAGGLPASARDHVPPLAAVYFAIRARKRRSLIQIDADASHVSTKQTS